MRDIIEAVDRGDIKNEGTATAALAAELEHRVRDVVTEFIKAHKSELEQTTIVTALVGAAAVQVMTLFDMGPDDFAELARAAGRLSLPEVEELRAKMRRTGIA
jgi:hypothetical protein